MAERAGGGRLRHLRRRDAARYTLPPEQALALADESSPVFLRGAFQRFTVARPRRAEDPRGVPQRRRRRLARAPPRPLRGHRAVLPPGLHRATSSPTWIPALDGVEDEAARRRPRGRRRLRARRLDDPDGEGVSRTRSSSASTTTRRRSRRARAASRGRRRQRPRALRGRARAGRSPARLRPRRHLRLPARHGRPGRALRATCSTRSRDDGTWLIVEPFAGDNGRGQPQPGRPRLLRRLDAGLHARLALAGGRPRARRAGGRGAPARGRHRRRLHALPPRDRDALQHGARGASVSTTIIAGTMSGGSATRAREPDLVGFVARGGVRCRVRVVRGGRAYDPLLAELDARPAAPMEGAGAVPVPPLSCRHVRPTRQRRLG